MMEGNLAQLQALAQGEGEMRVSRRLMRALLADLALGNAARRAQDMVDRALQAPSRMLR